MEDIPLLDNLHFLLCEIDACIVKNDTNSAVKKIHEAILLIKKSKESKDE